MSRDLGVETLTSTNKSLFAGSHPPVTIPITLVSGQNLVAGQVLGRITASGKYSAYDVGNSPAGVGSAVAILGEDCDATSGDEKTFAYVHGEFNTDELTGIDATTTLQLLALGLYVK